MFRFKTTTRGLALWAAVGLAQGGAAYAQPDPENPGISSPPPVTVVPGQTTPLYGVPQQQPPATQAAPQSTDPVYEAIPGVPTYAAPAATPYTNYKQIPVFVPYSARSGVDPKDKTRGENLLEAYYAPKYPTTLPLYGTTGPSWGPGGHVASGMRVGQPYYWSRVGYPGSQGAGYGPDVASGYAHGYGPAYGGEGPVYGPPAYGAGAAYGAPSRGCGCRGGASSGVAMAYGPGYGYQGVYGGGYGYGYGSGGVGDVGASVNAAYGGGAQAFSGNPHEYYFGPGYHRHSDHAHYRFPWYSYRAPWYHPGPASYNRDTNYPW
jgi:hypothetical protein